MICYYRENLHTDEQLIATHHSLHGSFSQMSGGAPSMAKYSLSCVTFLLAI